MFFTKRKFQPGSDEKAFLLYQKGDLSGIEQLIKKYENMVYGVCFKHCMRVKGYTAAKYQAEDLAQDVWRKIFQKASAYQPKAPFKAWLMTIARNTAMDWKKKAYLRNELPEGEFTTSDDEEGDSSFEEVASKEQAENNPEKSTMKTNLQNVVVVCKKKLVPDHQKMVEMYLAERSQRDMAATLGISLGAVNKRIRKVFSDLGRCFHDQGWTVSDIMGCFES